VLKVRIWEAKRRRGAGELGEGSSGGTQVYFGVRDPEGAELQAALQRCAGTRGRTIAEGRGVREVIVVALPWGCNAGGVGIMNLRGTHHAGLHESAGAHLSA